MPAVIREGGTVPASGRYATLRDITQPRPLSFTETSLDNQSLRNQIVRFFKNLYNYIIISSLWWWRRRESNYLAC
jgi:hypothetical protein